MSLCLPWGCQHLIKVITNAASELFWSGLQRSGLMPPCCHPPSLIEGWNDPPHTPLKWQQSPCGGHEDAVPSSVAPAVLASIEPGCSNTHFSFSCILGLPASTEQPLHLKTSWVRFYSVRFHTCQLWMAHTCINCWFQDTWWTRSQFFSSCISFFFLKKGCDLYLHTSFVDVGILYHDTETHEQNQLIKCDPQNIEMVIFYSWWSQRADVQLLK